MILQGNIIAWQHIAPWNAYDQVEHDLVLSRAICELYANPVVSQRLVFRGGTALHKLFFNRAGRFSEDLDFVQVDPEPIGETVAAIRDCLDYWLGNPSWKQNKGRFTLNYTFMTEFEPIIKRKVKIEINTREHFRVQPYIKKTYKVESDWFSGESKVLTYSLEELLGTKLRALYQRKKGRDLYDFWYVMQHIKDFKTENIVNIFGHYMEAESTKVSRAEFEKNLSQKKNSPVFNADIKLLLSTDQIDQYKVEEAYELLFKLFLEKLSGEPWKGLEGGG